MKNKITICTPTYNREHTLHRVYDSLLKQGYSEFTWLIIDDGSIDRTKKLVEKWIADNKMEIKYVYKANGGRHTALNLSYDFIETEWVVNMDSDDEFSEEALAAINDNINKIPKKDYDKYWCISGRCINNQTGEMVGDRYSTNINEFTGMKQLKRISKFSGEKSCCRKTQILREYKFPLYDGIKFVTESTVWAVVDRKYSQWCTNDVFRIYYTDSQDSLGKGKMHSDTTLKSSYNWQVFCINNFLNEIFWNKAVITALILLPSISIRLKYNFLEVLKEIKGIKKIVLLCCYPLGYLDIIRRKLKK